MPGEIRRALGARIRAARKQRVQNMPLEEFGRQVARLMGRPRPFSNVTVSNWETGRQEPSWEALISIARLTHLPLRYFAGAGELADYPLSEWLEPSGRSLDPCVRTLVGAVQRLEASHQRIVLRQVESLLNALEQEAFVDEAMSSRA